jgi:nucleotide-binding universal stress UspA family protein
MEKTVIPSGTVVVGIDGSPSSIRALDWAIEHATLERRPLTLAHGIDAAGSAWADPTGGSHRAIVDAMADDGRRLVEQARAHVAERSPGLVVHESAWLADPRVTLLKLAETASAVVVGSRCRGPVASLLLGSVSAALARHAPCTVVVVRPSNPGLVRNGIVVGADGSASSPATVEFAYRQASLRHLPLTILHCTGSPVHGATDDDLRLAAAEPLSGLAEKFSDVRATLEVVQGTAADQLVHISERMDLVVVGAHHGGRLSALLDGSVARVVVEHASCPVAVVPVTS